MGAYSGTAALAAKKDGVKDPLRMLSLLTRAFMGSPLNKPLLRDQSRARMVDSSSSNSQNQLLPTSERTLTTRGAPG